MSSHQLRLCGNGNERPGGSADEDMLHRREATSSRGKSEHGAKTCLGQLLAMRGKKRWQELQRHLRYHYQALGSVVRFICCQLLYLCFQKRTLESLWFTASLIFQVLKE